MESNVIKKTEMGVDPEGTFLVMMLFAAPFFAGLCIGVRALMGASVSWWLFFALLVFAWLLILQVFLVMMPGACKKGLNEKLLQKGILPSWKEVNRDLPVEFREVTILFDGEEIKLKELTDRMRAKTLSPAEESLIIFKGSDAFRGEFVHEYQGRFLDGKVFEEVLMKKPNFLFWLTGFNKKQLLKIIESENVSPLLLYGVAEEGKEAEYEKVFLDVRAGKIVFAKRMLPANIFSLIWALREDKEILEALNERFSKYSLVPLLGEV